jgi:hypothetical protein
MLQSLKLGLSVDLLIPVESINNAPVPSALPSANTAKNLVKVFA